MMHVIAHTEELLNQLADSRSGPKIGRKSIRAGSLENPRQQLLALARRNLGLPPRVRSVPQTACAALSKPLQRHLKPPQGAIENFDNLARLPTLLVKRDGFQPNTFQFHWASMPSHQCRSSKLAKTRKCQCVAQ